MVSLSWLHAIFFAFNYILGSFHPRKVGPITFGPLEPPGHHFSLFSAYDERCKKMGEIENDLRGLSNQELMSALLAPFSRVFFSKIFSD